MTPSVLAGGKVKVQVQRWAHRWATVKTVLRTIGSSGAYGWSYKPAKRGSYCLRATVVKTTANTAVGTTVARVQREVADATSPLLSWRTAISRASAGLPILHDRGRGCTSPAVARPAREYRS